MPSFGPSLVLFALLLSTVFVHANVNLPRHDVPQAGECGKGDVVTVTVTVTAPGHHGQEEPIETLSPYGSNPTPEYNSCFDRKHHAFNYSYHHGGYHFTSMPSKTSDAAPVSGKGTSGTSGKASSMPWIYPANSTTKAPSTGHYNSTSTANHLNVTSTSAVTSTSSASPSCDPELHLEDISESSFNKRSAPFSVKTASCSGFDVGSTTAFANLAPIDNITVTSDSIAFPGLDADYVLLSIFAQDTNGNAIIKSYQLHFGTADMSIVVLGPDGLPASGVLVQGNATIYPGVGQQCITDVMGQCSLVNLPATTISLVAKSDDNSIAVDGLATTTSKVTLKLIPFTQPTGVGSFDVDNGTTGWTGSATSKSVKMKRDTSLVLSTNGQYTLQSTSNSFKVHPFTKTVYIKYKFITAEVPGGYFGTQYNDYYSVTIRSDTGAFVTETKSMNALGLGAFDASGATDWFTLTLKVPADTKSVEYDLGVSNVADNLLDSSIVVEKVGDLQCDQCGDCASCPSDPMCQASCQNPPAKSCDFYRSCAEGQLGCGPAGYPLNYGEKNCLKFIANINWFSGAGQSFVFGTMHCLQTAMVPVLEPCTATCDSFQAAAFASHPGCYVQNGFCGLQCPDVLAVLMTVGEDLFTAASVKQVFQTAGMCISNIIETLSGCTGDIAFEAVPALAGASLATKIALKAALKLFKSAGGAGS